MAEMKAGYKQTDIGTIPEDWDEALIGDLFEFKNGLNKAKEFFGYGTPIVNYMDVFNFSGLRLNNLQGKVDVTFQEKQNFSVKKGDVFFTRTSETVEDIGVASVMLDDCNETVFSGFVLRGRPKSKSIEEDYCKYCFSSDEVRKQITSKSTYTTRALTNGRLLSSIALPLPKPEEQKQIAAALSDVDGLIESLSQLIAKKRDMKTATMQQLLTGKKRLPGFDGEWKEFQLGEFGNCLRGVSYSGATDLFASDNDDAAILLRSNNIKFARVNFSDVQFVKRGCVSTEQYLNENDIVICMANGSKKLIGKSAIFSDNKSHKFTFGAFMGCFRTDLKKSIPKFIFYLLNSDYCRKQIDVLLAGSSINNLTPKSVESMEFKFPDKDEQTAISAILSDMDAEIDALEQRLGKARSLKTGMMQELLTGKTRFINTSKKQEAA